MIILQKIKRRLKESRRTNIIVGVILLLVAIIVFRLVSKGNDDIVITVERGTVEEEVLVTGKTKAKSEVTLGFEKSGKVSSVSVSIGTRVSIGDRLVTQDQSDALASLSKARANLNQALIELNSIRQTSPSSFESTYQTHVANLRDAFVKADDAVRNGVDLFFTNPRSFSADFNPIIKDGNSIYYSGIPESVRGQISYERVVMEKILTDWEKFQVGLGRGEELNSAFTLARHNLNAIGIFLDNIASAINSIESVQFAYNVTIQGYKDSVSTARGKINTALTNILASKEKFDTAPTKIGVNYDDILVEEAKVASLSADVQSREADLAKTIISSPIAGVVTKLDIERGEIVGAGVNIVSVISDKNLQVEANVSEVNIGKVLVGNKTRITLDAFTGETYDGEVSYIDPGETIVDGVPTYKVSITFTEEVKEKVKSGLTANISIITQKKEGVIKVPIYTIEKRGGASFVTIKQSGGKEEQRAVTTGLVGKDGGVEIISGLSVGEEIVTSL